MSFGALPVVGKGPVWGEAAAARPAAGAGGCVCQQPRLGVAERRGDCPSGAPSSVCWWFCGARRDHRFAPAGTVLRRGEVAPFVRGAGKEGRGPAGEGWDFGMDVWKLPGLDAGARRVCVKPRRVSLSSSEFGGLLLKDSTFAPA